MRGLGEVVAVVPARQPPSDVQRQPRLIHVAHHLVANRRHPKLARSHLESRPLLLALVAIKEAQRNRDRPRPRCCPVRSARTPPRSSGPPFHPRSPAGGWPATPANPAVPLLHPAATPARSPQPPPSSASPQARPASHPPAASGPGFCTPNSTCSCALACW